MNSITQKNCVVELEFKVGTNQYKIYRSIKPGKFEVYQNGELMNQSAEMRDYQELLEKQILKLNYKSFSQVVVLGSATFQPFMQLSTSARREIIEDLLDLQIFTTMNSLLKDKMLANDESIVKADRDKTVLENKIEMLNDSMKEVAALSDAMISEKRVLLKESEDHVKELTDKANFFSDQIAVLEEKAADQQTIKKKIDKLSQLRHQILAKINGINDVVTFFHDHDSCPTCQQDIDEEHKNHMLEEKQAKHKELEEGLSKLVEERDKSQASLDKIMEVVDEVNRVKLKLIETKTKINSLNDYVAQLNKDITDISSREDEDKLARIREAEKELKDVEKRYNGYIEEKVLMNAAGVLLKDTGIKSRIIKQYIPVINKLINKYLSAMDFFVSFELDESFNETIKSRHRDDFTYASFSEGEKQKIDLALLFTWRAVAKLRNSISTNLLIMDEVFDSSLDQNATDYLMNIIMDIAKDSNIFIISHKEHMNEKFTNVLKFQKIKNFSQLQE